MPKLPKDPRAPLPESAEAREPRSECLCVPDGTAVRYELKVRLASRSVRSQVVMWSYDDQQVGIAILSAGADLKTVRRWNHAKGL